MLLASTIRDLHETFAFILIFSNAAVGVWGILLDRDLLKSSKLFWGSVIAAQSLIFVQAFLGVVLQTSENLAPRDFHYLYGFSMIIAVALLYGYRAPRGKHKFLMYGVGSFFIMGLGIRALFLGN